MPTNRSRPAPKTAVCRHSATRPATGPPAGPAPTGTSARDSLGDPGRDLAQGTAAVGDLVLLGGVELGGGEALRVVLVGDEEHVVAEAAGAAQLADHPAGHPALDDLLAP